MNGTYLAIVAVISTIIVLVAKHGDSMRQFYKESFTEEEWEYGEE